MNILLIDDDRDIRLLLKMLLSNYGHAVSECDNAPGALEICQRESFPLMVLDWELGEIDGIQLCRQLRALPHGDESVILMFTGRNSPEEIQMILEAGANDYMQKPADIKWLKIRLQIAIRQAENQMARKQAERQLAIARTKEVEIGSKIQQNLLLGKPPLRYHGIEIAARSIASRKVDGDFYDFYPHDDACFDLVIGDVMGKGIPAALLGAAIKSRILQAMNELKSQTRGLPPDLSRILSYVDAEVTPQLIELGTFVTLVFVRFYLEKKQIGMINCGHPRTIHFRNSEKKSVVIPGDNLPLGVLANGAYSVQTFSYGAGDLIFFYSDGITEARNAQRVFFGEERVVSFVHEKNRLPLGEFIDGLCQTVEKFSGTDALNDDRTCVAVKIMDSGNSSCSDVLELDGQRGSLARIREFVKEFCAAMIGETGDLQPVNRIVLAVNEAASNVIRHAYKDHPGGPLRICVSHQDRRIEFLIEHRGQPFQPPVLETERFREPRESGMGLYIIDEIMDEVEYLVRGDGWNTIRMVYDLRLK